MTVPDPGNAAGSRKALGRGLAALIPGARSSESAAATGLRTLAIEKIRPNPKQPRKLFDADKLDELAASIREQGVLQPVIVRRLDSAGPGGEAYELIAGERRWRAAARAGLQEIPVLVKEASDGEVLKLALVENIQRADLDPLEEAEAYLRLVREYGLTQEEVGQAVGKSRVAVTNSLRLLKLPEALIAMLADGRLTAGHARALMMVKSESAQLRLADEIVRHSTSVRDAESKARALARQEKGKRKDTADGEDGDVRSVADVSLEERISRALQTRVRLVHQKGKGHLEIFFHSFEHLDTLLERIER